MKVFNKLLILFCVNFQYSFAQSSENMFTSEISSEYNRNIHFICTANIFKMNAASGSPYVGMDNFGLGLGLSVGDQKTIPELIVNYTKTFYIFDFGIRTKISLNSNQKFAVVSPTFGVSMVGFFGAFYSYNLGTFSSDYMSKHSIGIKCLITNKLFK